MSILWSGLTDTGSIVPVQVDNQGRVVAQGINGADGPPGPQGPPGPEGPAGTVPTDFGAVGTYVLAHAPNAYSNGQVVPGSLLTPSNAAGGYLEEWGQLDGQWRCMGHSFGSQAAQLTTLFVRIS